MITKNELAQALIESYSPSTYKKSQLTEGSRRNKQSLYGMSQFNLPEKDDSNSVEQADASQSELDVQDIIYEFYVNKRNPTSADIAKLQNSGIWTIPTVDCYWKFYNEIAKQEPNAANIIKLYNTPQALYAYIKKHVTGFTWPMEICKSKYLFVSSAGAILSYVGYRRIFFSPLNFDYFGGFFKRISSTAWPRSLYYTIQEFIYNPSVKIAHNNNPIIKSFWEDTYGIKFDF